MPREIGKTLAERQEIRSTKTLLMKRREKLQAFNVEEIECKKRNEIIKKENEELINATTQLHGRANELESSIKGFEIEANALLDDIKFYLEDISILDKIREDEIKAIKGMYIGLDKILINTEDKLNSINTEAQIIHQKCVEEQSNIQAQKEDLKIYKERLQKKYDELNFGKIILTDK